MSAETYGEHQEAAAAALNRLITTELMPVDPAQVEHLLQCREAVLNALLQRLYALGSTHGRRTTAVPAHTDNVSISQLEKYLPTLVDRITLEVPTLRPDQRRSPADVLGRASQDLTVELWRTAAIELLAGTHARSTPPQSNRGSPIPVAAGT